MTPEAQTVPLADVRLVLEATRARFLQSDADSDNAIITALEGLKWLVGDETDDIRPLLEGWVEFGRRPSGTNRGRVKP